MSYSAGMVGGRGRIYLDNWMKDMQKRRLAALQQKRSDERKFALLYHRLQDQFSFLVPFFGDLTCLMLMRIMMNKPQQHPLWNQ